MELLLGVAGVAVGAVALVGLLALRPNIAVTAGEMLQASQVFSAPFRITNGSYFGLNDVEVSCYGKRVLLGSMTIESTLLRNAGWGAGRLDRQETRTVVCQLASLPQPPQEADVAIVVDYSPPWPLPRTRRVFRFQGAQGDSWQWHPQPADGIEPEVDAAFRKAEQRRRQFEAMSR